MDTLHIKLYNVPKEDLDIYWPVVSEYLTPAVEMARELDVAGVLSMLRQDELKLWIAWDIEIGEIVAAATTMFQHHASKQVLTIGHFGGDTFTGVSHLLPKIQEWAKKQGCKSVRVYGRNAWVKQLRPFGFNYLYTCVESDL